MTHALHRPQLAAASGSSSNRMTNALHSNCVCTQWNIVLLPTIFSTTSHRAYPPYNIMHATQYHVPCTGAYCILFLFFFRFLFFFLAEFICNHQWDILLGLSVWIIIIITVRSTYDILLIRHSHFTMWHSRVRPTINTTHKSLYFMILVAVLSIMHIPNTVADIWKSFFFSVPLFSTYVYVEWYIYYMRLVRQLKLPTANITLVHCKCFTFLIFSLFVPNIVIEMFNVYSMNVHVVHMHFSFIPIGVGSNRDTVQFTQFVLRIIMWRYV